MRSLAASPWATVVDTVAYLSDPVGVEIGEYNSQDGIFVSSLLAHNVYFFSLETLNNYRSQKPPQPVALFGGGFDVNTDGSLSTASIQDPSRLVYDSSNKLLYIASTNSMIIRVVNLRTSIAGTITHSSNAPIVFGSPVTSIFPGLDIQKATSTLLFVTSPKMLYKLVRKSSSFNSNSVTSYDSVAALFTGLQDSEWMLTSAAPDVLRNVLYVSVCGNVNQLLRVPIDATDASSSSRITILAGSNSYWEGLGGSVPSVRSDGAATTRIFMPVHLQFDNVDQLLMWSEALPVMEDILTGSLTIRQLAMNSAEQYVKFLAGSDAATQSPVSSDPDTYTGVWGGYTDGRDSDAEFKYPISIKYAGSSSYESSDSFPLVYVADRWNNVIRKVSRRVYTPAPSISPAPSRAPTLSQKPSIYPTPSPTAAPVTHRPSPSPTVSLAPTTSDMLGPSVSPTMVPTHTHAFSGSSHAPTALPSSFSVYEDNSFFGRLGASGVDIGPSDLLLGALIGCILAGVVVYILSIVGPRSVDGRKRRRGVRAGRRRGSSEGGADGGGDDDTGFVRRSDGNTFEGDLYGGLGALYKKLSGLLMRKSDGIDVSGNGRPFDRLSTYSPSEGGDDLSVTSDDLIESSEEGNAVTNSNLSRFIRGGSSHGGARPPRPAGSGGSRSGDHRGNIDSNEDAELGNSSNRSKQSVDDVLKKLKRSKFQDGTSDTSSYHSSLQSEERIVQDNFEAPPQEKQEPRGYFFGLF